MLVPRPTRQSILIGQPPLASPSARDSLRASFSGPIHPPHRPYSPASSPAPADNASRSASALPPHFPAEQNSDVEELPPSPEPPSAAADRTSPQKLPPPIPDSARESPPVSPPAASAILSCTYPPCRQNPRSRTAAPRHPPAASPMFQRFAPAPAHRQNSCPRNACTSKNRRRSSGRFPAHLRRRIPGRALRCRGDRGKP